MVDEIESAGVAGFLRGLRIAALLITATLLGVLALLQLLGHLSSYRSVVVQAAVYACLVGVTAVAAALTFRDRSWGTWCVPVAAGVLVLSLVSRLAVVPSEVVGQADWTFGTTGWVGVLLFVDRPLSWFTAFLSLHLGLTAVVVFASEAADGAGMLAVAIAAVLNSSFQLGVAGAAVALRKVARGAVAAAREREAARTADAVAARLHDDRRGRYAELARTAGPLLAGLADATMDPQDDDVQRSCAVEAARMRRLFAETDETDEPLLHELRAGMDVAERRGVAVQFAVQGRCAMLSRELRHALTEWPSTALASARTTARVTIIGNDDAVSVHVVADAVGAPVPEASAVRGVRISVVEVDDRMWVEATWTRTP